MSSPNFFSPTNSQSEMLGHIPTTEGNLGCENEGEGGADQDGSLCERWEWEPVEPLLLLIQQEPTSNWQFHCMGNSICSAEANWLSHCRCGNHVR